MRPDSRPGSIAARLAATTRVLSVEDDPDIAEFLRAYFRASGYDLIHLDPASAAEVVSTIEASRPDCVLLDIGLRGFSGFDAYDLLRAEPGFDHVPVVVVSADETVKDHLDRLRGAADGALSKPFNAGTLASLVATHIAAARDAAAPMSATALTEAIDAEVAAAAAARTPVSLALVRLRAPSAIVSAVGSDGLEFVTREIVRRVQALAPDGTTVGSGDGDDLVVVLPSIAPAEAVNVVDRFVSRAGVTVHLPGGADVAVQLAAGVAAFPDHASNPDELYMAADAALAEAVDAGRPVALAI